MALIADENVKPDPVVAPAGLEDEHPIAGIAAQSIGEHAAGRAGAGHNEVISFGGHTGTAQHATSRPCFITMGGFSTRQRSNASAQRGLNGHPGGGANGDGGSPVRMMRSRLAAGSATGVAESSARV